MINIAILNESTVLAAAELHLMIPAMQKQANEHFAPLWHTEQVTLTICKESATAIINPVASVNSWWLVFLDDSDQADALGYHDLTTSGKPISKVFAKTDLQSGSLISVTASHELLEMIGDPNIDTAIDVNADGSVFMMYESGDAVEDDRYAYSVNGVKLTDFVTPEWFMNFVALTNVKYDYCGHVTKPLQLLPGGYIGKFTSASGWTQDTNMGHISAKMVPRLGSRRERRARGRSNWKLSTVNM